MPIPTRSCTFFLSFYSRVLFSCSSFFWSLFFWDSYFFSKLLIMSFHVFHWANAHPQVQQLHLLCWATESEKLLVCVLRGVVFLRATMQCFFLSIQLSYLLGQPFHHTSTCFPRRCDTFSTLNKASSATFTFCTSCS